MSGSWGSGGGSDDVRREDKEVVGKEVIGKGVGGIRGLIHELWVSE